MKKKHTWEPEFGTGWYVVTDMDTFVFHNESMARGLPVFQNSLHPRGSARAQGAGGPATPGTDQLNSLRIRIFLTPRACTTFNQATRVGRESVGYGDDATSTTLCSPSNRPGYDLFKIPYQGQWQLPTTIGTMSLFRSQREHKQ